MAVDRYAEIHAAHRWDVPSDFNLRGRLLRARWASDRARFALYWEDEDGTRRRVDVLRLASAGEPPRQFAHERRRRPAATVSR